MICPAKLLLTFLGILICLSSFNSNDRDLTSPSSSPPNTQRTKYTCSNYHFTLSQKTSNDNCHIIVNFLYLSPACSQINLNLLYFYDHMTPMQLQLKSTTLHHTLKILFGTLLTLSQQSTICIPAIFLHSLFLQISFSMFFCSFAISFGAFYRF